MSELASLEEAFEAAAAETEDAPTSEVEEPTSLEDAFDGVDEQPTEESTVESEDDEDPFEDLEIDGVDLDEDSEGVIDIEGMTFELPGFDEPVTFQELRDGYLRQADYTRKTQTLAEQRKTNEKAIKLYEAIQADPMRVARQIAEEVGLIQSDQQPVKAVDFSVFQTAEAVEAEIQRRVEEAVAKHPAVADAQVARARDWVASEFSRIEQAHGVTLGPKSRQMILQFAADRQVTDLELVFNHFMAQKQSRSDNTRRAAAAAPGRSTGRSREQEPVEEPDSIEAAFALAEADLR